ncbi:MAG: hypothetical protein KAS38_19620 [Anaerolineales bacterium]|nr:hypothetical protein [Anaerolineales bacterium]
MIRLVYCDDTAPPQRFLLGDGIMPYINDFGLTKLVNAVSDKVMGLIQTMDEWNGLQSAGIAVATPAERAQLEAEYMQPAG